MLLKMYSIKNDIPGGLSDVSKLYDEVLAGGDINAFDGLVVVEDDLNVYGESFIDESGVDLTVEIHELIKYKNIRYDQIDFRTRELITDGFVFDFKSFSLSNSAQMNWNKYKDQEAKFTWPVAICSLEDETYNLAQVDLDNFWVAQKDQIEAHLGTGRSLKSSIFNAVNRAGIDAVVDNR